MKLIRNDNGKFVFKKLNWSGYCMLINRVNFLANAYVDSNIVADRVMGLVLAKLDRRLSKSDHYPLKDNYVHKSKINVSMEPEEIISIYELSPVDSKDPIVNLINLEIPKHF